MLAWGTGMSAGHSVLERAGVRRFRKGREAEVLCAFELLGEHVVAVLAFKGQA